MSEIQHRQEVSALLARFRDGLVRGELTVVEFDEIVGRLELLADQALPRLSEMLASADGDDRRAAVILLRELEDPRAVRPLRRALSKPEYSDEEKLAILRALDDLGETVDAVTLDRAISDPEALTARLVKGLLDEIESCEQVESFLGIIGDGPPAMQAQHIRDVLLPLADRRLLPLLTAMLHSEHDNVVMAAVDAIEQLKEPATIPFLEERGRYDPAPLVRHAAGNAALRLQVRFADKPSRPWMTPPSEPVVRCMLSTIDGNGGQVILLARQLPNGNWRILSTVFDDHEGISDGFSIVADEDELEFMMATFDACDFVDISLERCRVEASHAEQVTLDARRRLPLGYAIWRSLLEGEDPRGLVEFPLPVLDPVPEPSFLATCDELISLDEFSFWFFNPDEVDDFVGRYLELLGPDEEWPEGEAYDALLRQALETVVDDEYRRLLPARLRRQAWLLAQLYEDEEVPLWALAAASGIEDGTIAEHPLLRSMMELSLLNAAPQNAGKGNRTPG